MSEAHITGVGGGVGECRSGDSKEHQNAQNQNLKNNIFVDITISKVLRDLPLSRNQHQNFADDR